MRIKLGGVYRNSLGEEVTIVEHDKGDDRYPYRGSNGEWFTKTGQFVAGSTSEQDLTIAVHPTPPYVAPSTADMILPTDPAERKGIPITTGVLDYFPLAIAEVAKCSKAGNDQHNPGQPLHWAKDKSTDHADCIPRHLIDRGRFDTDGVRHSAKLAWRALALLQTELEAAKGAAQ